MASTDDENCSFFDEEHATKILKEVEDARSGRTKTYSIDEVRAHCGTADKEGAVMQAIVDRIEDGNVAVLELDGSRFLDVPLSEMPEGTRQGDVFDGEPGHWIRDDAAKAERMKTNAELMARLSRP